MAARRSISTAIAAASIVERQVTMNKAQRHLLVASLRKKHHHFQSQSNESS